MVYQVKHLFMGMVSRFYSYDSQDMAIGQGNDSCAAVCVCRNVVAGLHRGPKKGSSIGTGWYKFLSWNMMKYGSSICSSCFFQNPQFFSCFSMKKHGDFDLESSGNHQKKKNTAFPISLRTWSGSHHPAPQPQLDPPWRCEWSLKHWSQEFGTISWIIPVFFGLWWF